MITPEVSCKAVAVQNSSQWPCSMCPIPPAQTGGGEDIIYILFSLIFPEHPESGTHYKSLFGDPPWLHAVTVQNTVSPTSQHACHA